MPKTIKELADQFFADCEKRGVPPTEYNLSRFLWYACPSPSLCRWVEAAVRADSRSSTVRSEVLRLRLTPQEKATIAANAQAGGMTMSEFIRKRCIADTG